MKYFIYLTVSVFLIASFVIVINLPLRSLEPLLSKYFPEISYSNIEGSVWSGKITDLTFANEYLGDLNTETDLRNLEFYLNDNEVLVEGKLNIIGTLVDSRINLKEINFEIGSKKFLKKIPSISAFSGNNINITFDADGCYEASGNLLADLDRKGLLNQAVTNEMEVILGCKDKKLIGDFYSIPNQDVLKGNFSVDNELNYVLVANSAMVLSKISKLIRKPLSRAPDVKIKGNLYNFFYGEN
ncbi:type II secretion system protein N [SAR86 cluster bacterium]|nr:type II secretion system protein N [SAR86 cluster bacterium]